MSFWRARAQQRIADLVKDLPADATLEQRRKALWGKGWEAHDGSTWGRKMWGQEVRAYLTRHGAEFGPSKAERQFQFPDHVHFPFRGEGHAQG
jgi:hypothetical protein